MPPPPPAGRTGGRTDGGTDVEQTRQQPKLPLGSAVGICCLVFLPDSDSGAAGTHPAAAARLGAT